MNQIWNKSKRRWFIIFCILAFIVMIQLMIGFSFLRGSKNNPQVVHPKQVCEKCESKTDVIYKFPSDLNVTKFADLSLRMSQLRDECYTDQYSVVEKYGKTIWVLSTGIEVPVDCKTQLRLYDMLSLDYQQRRINLIKSFFLFHEWSSSVGLVYWIVRGNLISYVRDQMPLFNWEVDVDVKVPEDQFYIMTELWDQAEFVTSDCDTVGENGWTIKTTEILGGFPIVLSQWCRYNDFFKLSIRQGLAEETKTKSKYSNLHFTVDITSSYAVNDNQYTFEEVPTQRLCGMDFRAPPLKDCPRLIERVYGDSKMLGMKKHISLQNLDEYGNKIGSNNNNFQSRYIKQWKKYFIDSPSMAITTVCVVVVVFLFLGGVFLFLFRRKCWRRRILHNRTSGYNMSNTRE